MLVSRRVTVCHEILAKLSIIFHQLTEIFLLKKTLGDETRNLRDPFLGASKNSCEVGNNLTR